MKQPDDISDGYDAEDNSRKSYDLAISAMREKLESFRCERIGPHKLYLGDCRELLPLLGRVDVLVTDPPYGVGLTKKTNDYTGSKFFDNGKSLQASVVYDDDPGYVRQLIAGAIVPALAMTRRGAIFSGHRMMWEYPRPVSVGTVYVSNAAGRDPWGFGGNNPILYYGKCPYLAAGKGSRPNSFADNQPGERGIDHPTPKPVAWMRWLVDRVSMGGEVVLDPFMGSGTTGIACVNLGRRFVGIEVEPKFFDIACRRIEEATKQGDMFVPSAPAPIQISLLEPEPMTSKEKAAQQKALTVDGSRILAEAKKREEQETEALRQSVIEAAAPRNVDAREEWERLRKLDQAVEDIKLMTKGLRYVRRGRVESVSLVARPDVGRQLAAEVASVMDRPIDLGAPHPEAPEYTPPAIKAAPVVERKKRRKASVV